MKSPAFRLVLPLLIAGLGIQYYRERSENALLSEELAKTHKKLKELGTLQEKEKSILIDVKNALTSSVEKLKQEISAEQQIIDSYDVRLSREKNLGVGGEDPQALQDALKEARATEATIEGQLEGVDLDHKTRSDSNAQANAETRTQWIAFLNQLSAQAAGEDAAAKETQQQINSLKGRLDLNSLQSVQTLKTTLAQHKAAAADLRAQKRQYQAQQSAGASQDKANSQLEKLDYQKSKSALRAQLAVQKSTVRGLEDRLKATLAARSNVSRELQSLISSSDAEKAKLNELKSRLTHDQAELDQLSKL